MATADPDAAEISARALAGLLQQGEALLLLDVREPWEFAQASLPRAQNVPLSDFVPGVRSLADVSRDSLLVTFCHHGVRSLRAREALRQAGFRRVLSLAGGIDAWSTDVDPGVPRY